MKQILLIRHAEAEMEAFGFKDFDRALTSVGFAMACKIGKQIAEEKAFFPQGVYTSTALRAFTTAKLLGEQVRFDEEKIIGTERLYNASAHYLLEFINQLPPHIDKAMLVNHNPSITFLVEYLTGTYIGSMRPCQVMCVDFEIDDWKMVSQNLGKLAWQL